MNIEMKLFLVFLISGTLVSCEVEETRAMVRSVVEYSDTNFKTSVEKGPHFIMFFAPWCGHSRKFAPTWEDLANIVNAEWPKEATIARVDCTLYYRLCEDQGVSGYPTLKFFKGGAEKEDGIKYSGMKRNVESMRKFIKDQLEVKEVIARDGVVWTSGKKVNCWNECGNEGDFFCPAVCGENGWCCRKDFSGDNCPDQAREASTSGYHSCVIKSVEEATDEYDIDFGEFKELDFVNELQGVSCGGHSAEDCSKCVPLGEGANFCNGDCTWINDTCILASLQSSLFELAIPLLRHAFDFSFPPRPRIEPASHGNQITSTNYPNNYPHNEHTVQTLTVEAGYGMMLEIKEFQIEDDEECSYDYMQVCDGLGNCSPKLCGTKIPKPITLLTSTGTVVFHSDDSDSMKGFLLTFHKLKPGEKLPRCVTVGGGETGATCVFPFTFADKTFRECTHDVAEDGKYWCSTLVDDEGVHVGGKGKWGHCAEGCPGVPSKFVESITRATSTLDPATVSSRGVPSKFVESSTRATSTLNPATVSSRDCVKENNIDYKGYDIAGSGGVTSANNADECAEACRRNHKCKFWTYGDYCWMKYAKSGSRFKRFKYGVISGNKACGKGNKLTSTNFPNMYPNNEDTQQTLTVPEGYKMLITFQEFQLETHDSCGFDYVEICDENNLCEKKLCGTSLPDPITVNTSTATVKFHSDWGVSMKGFSLTYKKIGPGDCITISGPAAGSPCIFPFTFNGNTYNSCTTDGDASADSDDDDSDDSGDGDDGDADSLLPWCSTNVNSQGNHIGGYWGRCQGYCGVFTTTPRDTNTTESTTTVRGSHQGEGEWTAAVWLNDDSTQIVKNVGEQAFNVFFAKCPVVQYSRNGAVHSVYIRTSPIPPSFNAFSAFTHNWISANNELNADFRLYDHLEDAKNDRGAWHFCNYVDLKTCGVCPGYPRDCGKSGRVDHRWFRMPNRGKSSGITSGIGFDIYTGSMCPSPLDEKAIDGEALHVKTQEGRNIPKVVIIIIVLPLAAIMIFILYTVARKFGVCGKERSYAESDSPAGRESYRWRGSSYHPSTAPISGDPMSELPLHPPPYSEVVGYPEEEPPKYSDIMSQSSNIPWAATAKMNGGATT